MKTVRGVCIFSIRISAPIRVFAHRMPVSLRHRRSFICSHTFGPVFNKEQKKKKKNLISISITHNSKKLFILVSSLILLFDVTKKGECPCFTTELDNTWTCRSCTTYSLAHWWMGDCRQHHNQHPNSNYKTTTL